LLFAGQNLLLLSFTCTRNATCTQPQMCNHKHQLLNTQWQLHHAWLMLHSLAHTVERLSMPCIVAATAEAQQRVQPLQRQLQHSHQCPAELQ
jgi:hypothetical protein